MLVTDVDKEIRGILRSEKMTLTQFGRVNNLQTTDICYFLRHGFFVSKQLLRLMETIGYDVEIEFVKKHG